MLVSMYLLSGSQSQDYMELVCEKCGELTVYSGGSIPGSICGNLCLSDKCIATAIENFMITESWLS